MEFSALQNEKVNLVCH